MTLIRINFPAPDGGWLDGTVTFTHQHQVPGRPVTEGASVISGAPIRVEVSGEDTTVELRPTQAGEWYRVHGQVADGYRFTEHVQVLATLEAQTVDYGSLVRVDPTAGGLPYTPDPAWWKVADELLTLGGIPGKSAKEVIEDAYNLDLTTAEFEARIRGAKGDQGDHGRDGLTYLDYFRQAINNPQATDEDYHEWIRGRTALEQWAVYVGEDPAEAEVSDMLEWLRVDAFKLWKQHQGRPNATLGDFFAYFKGEKGDPSTVPGPRGERGKSAFQSVVESGYEGTEAEFSDALMGSPLQWAAATPLPGGSGHSGEPLLVRAEDGIIRIIGIIQVSDASRPLVRLPEGCRPDKNYVIHVGSNRSNGLATRLWIDSDGTVRIHDAEQGGAPTLLYLRTELPSADATVRPRIPGPQGEPGNDGTSAAQSARNAGWEGEDWQFYERMRDLAIVDSDDWQRWMEDLEYSQGPTGPRGYSAYDVVVDSGYEGSEEDFAGELLGEEIEWTTLGLSGGWGHGDRGPFRYKVVDGMVHLSGSLSVGDSSAVFAQVPSDALPDATGEMRLMARNSKTPRGLAFTIDASNGEMSLAGSDVYDVGASIDIQTSYPVANGSARPRIPGPAGLSAVELLQQDGLDMPAAEITRRLRVLVEGVE